VLLVGLIVLSKNAQSVVIFLLGSIGSMIFTDEVNEFSFLFSDNILGKEIA